MFFLKKNVEFTLWELQLPVKFVPQIKKTADSVTHPVFSLPDLKDLELLPAGAQGDLSVDLVVDALGVGQGAAVLPVGPEEAKQAH